MSSLQDIYTLTDQLTLLYFTSCKVSQKTKEWSLRYLKKDSGITDRNTNRQGGLLWTLLDKLGVKNNKN